MDAAPEVTVETGQPGKPALWPRQVARARETPDATLSIRFVRLPHRLFFRVRRDASGTLKCEHMTECLSNQIKWYITPVVFWRLPPGYQLSTLDSRLNCSGSRNLLRATEGMITADRNAKRFTDTDGEQPRWMITERSPQSGGGLIHGFAAEAEGLVVNRDKVQSACLAGHIDRLLRTAMRVDPRIIGTDRHQHKIDRAQRIIKRGKSVRVCGITRKTDRVSISFQEVAVVAAMLVAHHACAPVRDFHRSDGNWAT